MKNAWFDVKLKKITKLDIPYYITCKTSQKNWEDTEMMSVRAKNTLIIPQSYFKTLCTIAYF